MLPQKGGDRGDVAHQRADVRKDVAVDPLQNITHARVHRDEVGAVDVTALDLGTLYRCSLDGELIDFLLHTL